MLSLYALIICGALTMIEERIGWWQRSFKFQQIEELV